MVDDLYANTAAAAASATTATTQADNSTASALLSQAWATQTDSPVSGTEYGAKYYADLAALNNIVADTTINVPSDFATIQEAVDSLAQSRISNDVTVTIKVADGTYTLTSSIVANHPYGDRIRIIGNETTPDNCIITVSGAPTFDAFVVSVGHTLGYLNGFYFTLDIQ